MGPKRGVHLGLTQILVTLGDLVLPAKGLLITGRSMYSWSFRLVYGKAKKQVRRVGHLIIASAAPLTNPYFALSYLLMPFVFFRYDCHLQHKFVCAVPRCDKDLPTWKKIMGLPTYPPIHLQTWPAMQKLPWSARPDNHGLRTCAKG